MDKKENRGRKQKETIASKIIKHTKGGTVTWNYIYKVEIYTQAVIENRWELDIVDLAVFNAIEKYIQYGNPNKYEDENGIWYWVTESKILSDMPLLPLNSNSAVYKRISNLINCGLIERNSNNASSKLKHIRIGHNASKLYYKKYNKDHKL